RSNRWLGCGVRRRMGDDLRSAGHRPRSRAGAQQTGRPPGCCGERLRLRRRLVLPEWPGHGVDLAAARSRHDQAVMTTFAPTQSRVEFACFGSQVAASLAGEGDLEPALADIKQFLSTWHFSLTRFDP